MARFDLNRDNDPFALLGNPNVVVPLAATMKNAARFAQFVSDGFAEILHAAARARIEACAMTSI